MQCRVLLIDDHSPSRTFLASVLNEEGFTIVGQGSSGESSLSLVRRTKPDVVLMAVGLADMDGIRASRRIMDQNPVAIVLLTSHYEQETVERAIRAGIAAYLIKPLRREELRPCIELAVSRYEEIRTLKRQNEDLKHAIEVRKDIERAKGILMKSRGLSESDAFALLQRRSMDTRKSMAEIARAVILTEDLGNA